MDLYRRYFRCFCLTITLIVLTGHIPAANATNAAGKITSIYGKVWLSSNSQSAWRRASKNDLVYPGDEIKTELRSGVSLVMEDESLMRLGSKSYFAIESVDHSSFWRAATALVTSITSAVQSTFKLTSGRLWMRNNNRSLNSKVITTSATIGIRGTELTIEADQNMSNVKILEGAVLAQNESGEISVKSGEKLIIDSSTGFFKSELINQRDAVQWTVKTPSIIDIKLLTTKIKDKKLADKVTRIFNQSDFESLSQIVNANDQEDEIWFLLSTWVDLYSGNSSQAFASLTRRIESHNTSITVKELAAFAAIINGEGATAQLILEPLLKQNALSSNGYVVQGYLKQSQFDLDAAIDSYQSAIRLDHENNLARLQLARVLFGSDSNQLAIRQVRHVLRLDDNNLAALNLLGFIQLANLETGQAIQSWNKTGDSADDETHFGLSLAYMRQGKVGQAFQNIATAVALNPQKSIYLSYWGKMLYQTGRLDKALVALESAIRLDPKDPTPHLYRAIILRDLNRPGEAINEIQTAIKLNDNKGVYRSRSLLDKDLAVQNVDLSRLYTQLGLSNWAQNKAMASIKSDYSNTSAHILIAGAFADQEDRSYPLMSSALLARLMQPANTNAFSSFNTYTSLFEAPSTEHILEIGAGNDGQESLSYISYGANPESHTAWSLAAVHEATDGWRDTNGESFDDLAVIGKWQPDQDTNFLITASVFESVIEDNLFNRFEIDSVSDNLAEFKTTNLLLELGLHQKISKNHHFLTHLSILDNEGDLDDNIIDQEIVSGSDTLTLERVVESEFERPLSQIQLQGLLKLESHQIFYGVLYYDGKSKIDAEEDFGFFDPNHVLIDPLAAFDDQINFDLDTSFNGVYLQDSWNITTDVMLDIAVYHEQMDNANALTGGEWTIEESSPRLGLIWNMTDHQTIRAAAFQYLLPFISARLDPVDVAGIPIFKNTNEGSLVKEVDLVWEYEWDRGLVSANIYKLEEEFTSSILSAGQQIESTSEGEKEGTKITGNLLLGDQSGLLAEIEYFELADESLPSSDREETRITLGYAYAFKNGLNLSVEEILRELDFDSDRESESIEVTNLKAFYEFDNKQKSVGLKVLNLFDEEFNWVTDEFATSGIPPAIQISGFYTMIF